MFCSAVYVLFIEIVLPIGVLFGKSVHLLNVFSHVFGMVDCICNVSKMGVFMLY